MRHKAVQEQLDDDNPMKEDPLVYKETGFDITDGVNNYQNPFK